MLYVDPVPALHSSQWKGLGIIVVAFSSLTDFQELEARLGDLVVDRPIDGLESTLVTDQVLEKLENERVEKSASQKAQLLEQSATQAENDGGVPKIDTSTVPDEPTAPSAVEPPIDVTPASFPKTPRKW